jgi:hypothetical protein
MDDLDCPGFDEYISEHQNVRVQSEADNEPDYSGDCDDHRN